MVLKKVGAHILTSLLEDLVVAGLEALESPETCVGGQQSKWAQEWDALFGSGGSGDRTPRKHVVVDSV